MTFVKYLLKKFIPIFLGSLFFFSFILVMIDLFMNLWNYITQQIPPMDIFRVEFLYIPKAMSFSIPMAILFATSYTLSDLYAKNELTSIFASGVSLFKFTLPLLIISFFLSIGFLFFEDKIVVPTLKQKNELQADLLNTSTSKNNDRIVVLGKEGMRVYKAEYYDDSNKRLHGIYIVQRKDDYSLDYIVRADSALWSNDIWNLFGVKIYKLENGNLIQIYDMSYAFIDEGPETFQRNVTDVTTVNINDAKEYIAHLKRIGVDYNEELSEYYKKFSFPFVVFIVVFLSIGLSGKTRKNVLLMSLVFSLSAAVAFYVMQMVTMLLAQFGYVSPVIGAWFPVIIFVVLSIVLLKFART
ncbi:MAG: LptF/LptG family permease [Spirochaetaceae bacterium]|nr:LptF/LptG family permease [Spirochaetaceae bacterium]